jgi:hypothetical protein
MFWRVELDKEGSIKSCDYVPEQGRNGGKVIYVEAETKALACAAAKSWYAGRQRRSREGLERARAKGKCGSCKSRNARPGKASCQQCCDAAADQKKRKRQAVRAGTWQPRAPTPIAIAHVRNVASSTRSRARRGHFHVWSDVVIRKCQELGAEGFLAWVIAEQDRRAAEWAAINADQEAAE